MEDRRKLIDAVMSFEFPHYSNAPPPPPSLHATAEDLVWNELRRSRWEQQLAAQDARRAELSRLPDEQLRELVLHRDRERREQQTPPAHEPKWQFWTLEDEWDLHDAALLLVSLDPHDGLGAVIKPALQDEAIQQRLIESLSYRAISTLSTALGIMRRAGIAGRRSKLIIENGVVEPRPFLRWASEKYNIPLVLETLITEEQKPKLVSKQPADKPKRRNLLSPTIEKAQQGTDGSKEAVWLKLRELALAGEPPFTGVINDEGALGYTDVKNHIKWFARDALRNRFNRK